MHPDPVHLPSIHICFHCFESLVCLEASGFWYILNTKPSLGLLLNILLLSCVMEPLYFWSLSLAPSHAPVVLWWGGCSGESTYTLVLRLGGSWIVQTASFPSSSTPKVSNPAVPLLASSFQPIWRNRVVLLLSCPWGRFSTLISPALLFCLRKVMDLLSWELKLVRGGSPHCHW